MNLFSRILARVLPFVPKAVVGAAARRYIAGETIDEALVVASDLNRQGFSTTVDLLGEDTTDRTQARKAASDYLEILDAIEGHGIDGNVSVKPTQFGLKIDRDLCLELFRALTGKAQALGHFVRVEMEDSTCTDATLALFKELKREFPNVGAVIQAYLYRSPSDVESLIQLRPNVRMVKGVYVEPPTLAYPDPQSIRDAFLSLSETFLKNGSYVAFATHDEELVSEALRLVERLNLGPGTYEFQMLLGVQERLRKTILDAGHPMRVYIPFGTDWYPYSIRRLRENPQILGYVVKSMLRKE